MNLNRFRINSYLKVNILFFILILVIECLILSYWFYVLQPRINMESQANARIIAESQGKLISQSLISEQGFLQLEKINEILDEAAILKDPLLNDVFFSGISIELDPSSMATAQLNIKAQELISSRGNTSCKSCFFIEVALYSPQSDELIGLANFYVNDAIFHQFVADLRNTIFALVLIVFVVAIIFWVSVLQFVKQLHQQNIARIKAQKQADAAYKVKSQFLANMSHELRTPLNSIIGMTYVMLRGDYTKKQYKYLNRIASSSKLLLNLVNNVLDFSKNDEAKFKLEIIPFSLNNVIDKLNNIISSAVEEKKLEIAFSIDKNIPATLLGDPIRLGQVLLNLSSNAIKFTPQGSVNVNVKLIKQTLDNVSLLFCIKDTGIGIDSKFQDKIFQPFTQVDATINRKYGGTGLGLAICAQVTNLMQGKIWFESHQGEGSQFYFTADFGVSNVAIEKEKSIDSIQVPLWPNLKLLLVEDVVINQEVIASILEETQMDIDIANDGIEAVNKIKKNSYNLVLMDIQMPNMNGCEATKLVRKLYTSQQLPIIAMTAYSEYRDKENCLDIGMNDFIAKPIDVSKFFNCLKSWLPESLDSSVFAKQYDKNVFLLLQSGFTGINLVDALYRCKNEPKQLDKLVNDFIQNKKKTLPELKNAIIDEQWEVAENIVHAIKGSSGNLSLSRIYDLTSQFRTSFIEKDKHTSLLLLQQLETAFDKLSEFSEHLHSKVQELDVENETGAPLVTEVDFEQLEQIIKEMKQLIRGNNLKAEKVFKQLSHHLTAPIYKKNLEQLNEYLLNMDFDNALLSINQISKQLHDDKKAGDE